MSNKPYTTAVWWLVIIIIMKTILVALNIFSMQQMVGPNEEYYNVELRRIINNQLISHLILVVILVAEAITYWKIRYRTVRKGLVSGHLVGLSVAFIIMPVVANMYAFWITAHSGAGGAGDKLASFFTIQRAIIWAFIIIGHVCFVMVLMDAYRKKTGLIALPADGTDDILNDYDQ